MPDLDSVYVVGRFGISAEDGSDPGDDPDAIWCDQGEIYLEPKSAEVKVVGGTPVPWTAGQSTFKPAVDAEGYMTWRGQRFIKLVDLTSEKVNPRVVDGKATHGVAFRNLKADSMAVNFTDRAVRISADMTQPLAEDAAAAYGLPVGTPVCDLTRLLPVPVANATPIVIGPRGTGVTDLVQPTPTTMALELTDGTTTDEIDLPAGPGGSDAGVAGYLASPTSASSEAAVDRIATAVADPTDPLGVSAKQLAGVTAPGDVRDGIDGRIATVLMPALVIAPEATGDAATDTATLLAEMDALPDGSTLVLRGDYSINGTIANAGKSITLDLTFGKIIRTADVVGLEMTAAATPIYAVSATPTAITISDTFGDRDGVQFTTSAAASWQRGDVVKVVADDILIGGRPGTGDGKEHRAGQFFVVHSVSGTTVKCMGSLREPMTTNIRVQAIPDTSVSIVGGKFDVLDAAFAAHWTSPLARFTGLANPSVERSHILKGNNFGFQFNGCYGYNVDRVTVGYGLNNVADGNYGYAVTDISSWFGKVDGLLARLVRHAWTDAAPWVAADAPALTYYGRTLGTIVSNGQCHSSSNTAWDTHSWSEAVTFDNCVAVQCRYGFALRGKKHQIKGGHSIECPTGLVIFNEGDGGDSWGHDVDGLTIRDPKFEGVLVQLRPTGHPSAGVRETRLSRLKNITITGCSLRSVALSNGTIAMDNVQVQAPAAFANASQAVVELVNSELRSASVIDVDMTPLASATTARIFSIDNTSILDCKSIRYQIDPANATKVERIFYSPGSGQVYVRETDVSHHPSGGTVNTALAAGSRVGYRVRSGNKASSFLSASSTDVSGGNLATIASRSPDPTFTARVGATAAATLTALLAGAFDGQRLTIINTTTNASALTIPHGVATYKISLKSGANVTLNARDSISLTWSTTDNAWLD